MLNLQNMKRKFEAGSNDSLSEEITQKFESLQEEKKENEALKRTWIEEMQSIARKKYPEAELVLIGSSANMFGFKNSDCDLTLITGERFVYSALDDIKKLLPTSKFETTVTIVVLYRP